MAFRFLVVPIPNEGFLAGFLPQFDVVVHITDGSRIFLCRWRTESTVGARSSQGRFRAGKGGKRDLGAFVFCFGDTDALVLFFGKTVVEGAPTSAAASGADGTKLTKHIFRRLTPRG